MISSASLSFTRRGRLNVTALVFCTCFAAACRSWHVETLPTPTAGPIQVVGPLRVTLRSDSVIDLTQVVLTRDSIIGMTDPADWTRRGRPVERLAFARRDVIQARTSSPSRTKTVMVLVTVTFVAALAYALSLPLGVGD